MAARRIAPEPGAAYRFGADAWQHGKKMQITARAGVELEVISD
jgi:hypothetical protein